MSQKRGTNKYGINKTRNDGRERILKELLKSDAFCAGMIFGINLYQNKVISAHKRNEPLKIGGEIYYLQTGRERLEDVVDRICR